MDPSPSGATRSLNQGTCRTRGAFDFYVRLYLSGPRHGHRPQWLLARQKRLFNDKLGSVSGKTGLEPVKLRAPDRFLVGVTPGVARCRGLGQGWMAVVAAELFGIPGIGQRMSDAAGLLATDVLVVCMLTIALLYALSDMLLQRVGRRLLAWVP